MPSITSPSSWVARTTWCVTKPRQVITLLPGSRGTPSQCARGMDGSTYFDTTEKRCLRASFTNPRFVTKAVKEPDEFTSQWKTSTTRNLHRNWAAVAASGAPSHRDNSFFAGPAEQCHAQRVAFPGRAEGGQGTRSTRRAFRC